MSITSGDDRDLEAALGRVTGSTNPLRAALVALAALEARVEARLRVLEAPPASIEDTRHAGLGGDGALKDPRDVPPTSAGGLSVLVPARAFAIEGVPIAGESAPVVIPRPGDPIFQENLGQPAIGSDGLTEAAAIPLGCGFASAPTVEARRPSGTILGLVSGEDYTAAGSALTILADSPRIRAGDDLLLTWRPAAGTWTAVVGHLSDGTAVARRGLTSRPLVTIEEAGLLVEPFVPAAAVRGVATSAPAVSAPMLDATAGAGRERAHRWAHRGGGFERNRMDRGHRYQAESAAGVIDIGVGAGGASGPAIAGGETPESLDVLFRREVTAGLARWRAIPSVFMPFPRVLLVTPDGDDATAVRGNLDRPYATPEAARDDATVGDLIYLLPGAYDLTAAFTVPDGVAVRGCSLQTVSIRRLGVSSAADLVVMGENSRVEDIGWRMTSSSHVPLTGVRWPGTTSATAKFRTCTVTLDNSGAGAGSSPVIGMLDESSGTPGDEYQTVRATTTRVISTGSGTKRGYYRATAGRFSTRDSNFIAEGGTDCVGVETNHASAVFTSETGGIGGDTSDIKQTLGSIRLAFTRLIHANAAGLGFTGLQTSWALSWSAPGNLVGNQTRYFFPGTEPPSVSEGKIKTPRPSVLKRLIVRASSGPGPAKTDTWTIRKNGVDTSLAVSLTGTATAASAPNVSESFAAGDDVSLKSVTSNATATADPIITAEVY